jgi:hypothetical protein
VGGGISGLAAAHFYCSLTSAESRILILDNNHDDFGGHAKRNEFDLSGHLHLLNDGTLLIDVPTLEPRVLRSPRSSRISYEAFLRDLVHVEPAVLNYYHARTKGEWGVGTDAVSALDC